MKYYGDIPVEHLETLNELVKLEDWFSTHGDSIAPSMAAKGFVSMSHDYFAMYMDEEGCRMLRVAESCCQGYFKNKIADHRASDGTYDYLVECLKNTSGVKLMRALGFVG